MNALVGGSIHRRDSTTRTDSSTHPRIAKAIHFSIFMRSAQGLTRLLLDGARGHDHHVFHGGILISLTPPRFHRRNLVDGVHALGHASEHGIAVIARTVV